MLIFLPTSLLSCATAPIHSPKIVKPASSYINHANIGGVEIAVEPMGAEPGKKNSWWNGGICPTKIVINNNSSGPVVIEPSQITCTDASGVNYKPFTPQEAADNVIASEAFRSYAQGALAGAIFGAALGAALGAAVGSSLGGSSWAGRGAAVGAARYGAEGAVLGAASNRIQLEVNTRATLNQNALQRKVLAKHMKDEGYVYFPAVNLVMVEILVADPGYANVTKVNIPVTLYGPASSAATETPVHGGASTPPAERKVEVQKVKEQKSAIPEGGIIMFDPDKESNW